MIVRAAEVDGSLEAIITRQTGLSYAEDARPESDRPRHVRAGSSLARVPGGIAVVQDDANFLAVVEPSGRVTAIELPAGPGGRRQFDNRHGNKAGKLDLEACVTLEARPGTPLLLAFGSGSSPLRNRIALVEWLRADAPAVSLVEAGAFYAELAQCTEFAGTQLNIEGALTIGEYLRLFGRGTGRRTGAAGPVNATCDVQISALLEYLRAPTRRRPPRPGAIVQYELGAIAGVPLGFTDATLWRGQVLYTASAEETADAVVDGPVTGSAIGVITEDGVTRWCRLTDPDGSGYAGKVEGVVASESSSAQLLVVVDPDDVDAPSLLCDVELRGPWMRADPR